MSARAADTPATARDAWRVFRAQKSPRLLAAALAVALGARVAVGGFGWVDLAAVVAVAAAWPLVEWLIHVCILHWRPRRIAGRVLDFPVPRKHRAHHRDPWNLELVFIPFHSFTYSLPLLVGLCFAVAPTPGLALTALVASLAGALHYETVHFLVHTRVTPRTRYYRHLWRNHRLHHFKNEHYWYGVTRTEADRWLSTAPAAEGVATSPTARSLVPASD